MTTRRTHPGGAVPAALPSTPPGLPFMEPPGGVAYPQLLRGGQHEWWRPVLGVAAAVALYLMITPVVFAGVVGLGYLLQQPATSRGDYFAAARAFASPVGMLAQNLAIVSMIPIAAALMVLMHRVRPAWLSSVRGRIRWKYLLLCLGAALVLLNATALLGEWGGAAPILRPQAGLAGFVAVIVLTSPVQAAAEEYLFRGYLLQALGSLFGNPWLGVVLSATLFALFHGVQNPALFFNRLGFGLLAGALVLKTGGLEAGIGIHIANNLSAYLLAGLTSSIATLRAVRSLSWVDSAVNLGAFALCVAAALLIARRLRLDPATTSPTTNSPAGAGT